MTLKIVHVSAYPYHGGIQEYAFNLAQAQAKLGYDVSVLITGVTPKKTKINYILSKPIICFFRNPISLDLVKNFFKGNYDIIHVHLPFPITGDLVILLNHLFDKRHKKLFITYHFDIDLENFLGRIVAFFYNNLILKNILYFSDGIFVTSKRFILTSPILRKYKHKIIMKTIGVDTKLFTPSYNYLDRILFVGRIIPEKGIEYLIQAVKLLNFKAELLIIGKIVDKNYYKYLDDLVKNLNLNNSVSFTGYISKQELINFYKSAKVIVLPSTTRLESFGITLLEAMATGKPVIATDVIPGAVEFIEKCKCGIIVPPRDSRALAEAIKEIFSSNVEFIGRNAREYIEKYCDWEVIAKEIIGEYYYVKSK